MQKKYIVLGLFFISILVLIFVCVSKISAGELYGQVRYRSNKFPVPKFKIEIERKYSLFDHKVIYTNENGIYSIYLGTGWYTLKCEEMPEKEIYIPFSTVSVIFNITIP